MHNKRTQATLSMPTMEFKLQQSTYID